MAGDRIRPCRGHAGSNPPQQRSYKVTLLFLPVPNQCHDRASMRSCVSMCVCVWGGGGSNRVARAGMRIPMHLEPMRARACVWLCGCCWGHAAKNSCHLFRESLHCASLRCPFPDVSRASSDCCIEPTHPGHHGLYVRANHACVGTVRCDVHLRPRLRTGGGRFMRGSLE